ncbi:hypothetical protein ES703_102847 [subsurface metagenome]
MAVPVTVAVPLVVVDCKLTVASPDTAALVVVSNNVPSPLTENVIVFVAVVIGLSPASYIVAVIKDVLEPSASMVVGAAVFMSFTAPTVVFTFTVPSVKSVAVPLTVAVPAVAVDCNFTVAFPDTASFTVVPNRAPSPVTENVIVFVAVVTGVFPASHIVAVIKDVLEPSANIPVGFAAFRSFFGVDAIGNVILSFAANVGLAR